MNFYNINMSQTGGSSRKAGWKDHMRKQGRRIISKSGSYFYIPKNKVGTGRNRREVATSYFKIGATGRVYKLLEEARSQIKTSFVRLPIKGILKVRKSNKTFYYRIKIGQLEKITKEKAESLNAKN